MSATLTTMALGTGMAAAYAGIKTAEAQLAKTLSSSLSQYLDIDPQQDIEAQLLASGNIELTNIRLIPQNLPIAGSSGTARLEGNIDKISFSWTWGLNLLNDSTLIIHGVRLRLVIDPNATTTTVTAQEEETSTITATKSSTEKHHTIEDVSTTESESESSEDSQEASSSTSSSSSPNTTVQNILDQLSLTIADIKLEIHIKNSDMAPIIVEVDTLGLLACGRQRIDVDGADAHAADVESPQEEENHQQEDEFKNNEEEAPLFQQVIMKLLRVYIVSHANNKEEEIPILEPIDYMANVIRHSGQRFGGASGLEIVGKLPEKERPMVLHLGKSQIQSLLALQAVLAPSDTSTPTDADNTNKSGEPEDVSVVLPIPAIQLVLPNDATIATKLWRFMYFPKESVCQLEGKGTSITVGPDDFKVLQLDDAAAFLVNLTGKIVALTNTESSDPLPKVAQIDWQEQHTKPVLNGLAVLSELLNPAGHAQKKAQLEARISSLQHDSDNNDVLHPVGTKVADGARELKPSKPWSFTVDGMIGARFEGCQRGKDTTTTTTTTTNNSSSEEWLETSLTSPYFEMAERSDELIHKVGLERARIGPTSFGGDMMFDMGPTSLETNAMKKTAMDTISLFMQRLFGMHH